MPGSNPSRVCRTARRRQTATCTVPPTSTRSISSSVVEDDEVGGEADVEHAEIRARRARAPASRSRRRLPPRAGPRARAGCGPPRSSSARCPPARRPGRARCPRVTRTSKLPKLYSPSATPAAVIASVTSASRPAAARQATRAVSGARWIPSRMIETITSSRASAAPDDARVAMQERPHRVEEVRDARAPRSKAAFACSAVASLWPSETVDAALEQPVDQVAGARQLGRERHQPHRPARRAGARAAPASGSRRDGGLVRAESRRREERPFEMHAEDARPGLVDRHLAHRGEHLRPRGS